MNPLEQSAKDITRRHFLGKTGTGLGAIALGSLLAEETQASRTQNPNQPPKAKHVIFLHMAGSPPQQELFDYKPKLVEFNMKKCPDELLKNQRFAFIKGHPKLLGSPYKFQKHGESGIEVSELLPHFSQRVDDITVVKSMWTDQFNHAPAQLFLYTGSRRFGNASMGSWVTYGLGSENTNLPAFVVLVSGGTDPSGGKSLWGSGFLPSVYQGVQCRTQGEPILYVTNPQGMNRNIRRQSLNSLKKLNELEHKKFADPETQTRISQYELAFRMQTAVPEAMDIAKEPKHIQEAYGTQPGKENFANSCLLARRLVERGVRFVQLFDYGWDTHGTSKGDDIIHQLPKKCKQIDRPIAALLKDLKQRGLLDETLVVWSGEFGRTSMNEARGGSKFLGRDHHPQCYTIWMAGGGIKAGQTVGETDELGYIITKDKITVNDLQATILHQLGIDPYELRYPYQGLQQRLIGPADAPKVQKILLG